MALFKDWQDFADKKSAEPGAEQYWTQYFLREKDFYEKLLKGEAPKSGTVQALADHFGVDIIEMTGYLQGGKRPGEHDRRDGGFPRLRAGEALLQHGRRKGRVAV